VRIGGLADCSDEAKVLALRWLLLLLALSLLLLLRSRVLARSLSLLAGVPAPWVALRRASVAENKPPAQSPSISGRSWSWARSAPARCVVVVDSLDAIIVIVVVIIVTVLTLGSIMAVAVDACSWSFTDSDHQAYVAVWGVRGSKSRDPRSPSNQRANQRANDAAAIA